MGAGLSKEREYQIVYRELKKIQRELDAAGVKSTYRKRSLTQYDLKGKGFFITFRRSNASNGECFLRPTAQVMLDNKLTDYTGCEWMPEPSFRKDALPVILAHFATAA